MLEALLILMCFISGFLTKGLYDSIRERKRREAISKSLEATIELADKLLKTRGN